MTIYKDEDVTHDHTYLGNGCSNGWSSGSKTPCNTRIVSTADSEPQKNGTYYHFQAATSGSGGGMSTKNSNSPDTFCPLGWKLPYSGTDGDYYDKSKSWKYLFNKYGLINDSAGSTAARTYPFSYIYSGTFDYNTGYLHVQGVTGLYWSPTINNGVSALYLIMWSSALEPVNGTSKLNAYPLRCNPRVSILILKHN